MARQELLELVKGLKLSCRLEPAIPRLLRDSIQQVDPIGGREELPLLEGCRPPQVSVVTRSF